MTSNSDQSHTMEERHLFGIDGMWCGGCARGLEARLRSIEGVIDAGVHFITSSALVRWDPKRCDQKSIAQNVQKAGYKVFTHHDLHVTSRRMSNEIARLSIRLAVALFFGMWSMAASISLYIDTEFSTVTAWWLALTSGVLALPVILFSGSAILRMGLRSIFLRTPSIDLLISLGVFGAIGLSTFNLLKGSSAVYFDTAIMLVTLLLIGRLVETNVRRGAVDAITAMDRVSSETAKRINLDGVVEEIACAELAVGDHVAIEAGAISSVDGKIVEGFSMVDHSIISGESLAVAAGPGGRISAGSVNLSRQLIVCVDRLHGDRDLDRMGGRIAIEIAGRGEAKGSVDSVSDWLVVCVPILAVAVSLWSGLAAESVEIGFIRGLSVLAVACPCALSIATPLAYVRAAAAAAQMGFRIRDPAAFEYLATIRTAIFDKTGTLTAGQPSVAAIETEPGWTKAGVLRAAVWAETAIDHPLARAIIKHHGGPLGSGGERLSRGAIGIDAQRRKIQLAGLVGDQNAKGLSKLSVTVDEKHIGTIALSDAVRPEAAQTISALGSLGITVMMATGDAEGPALNVAAQLGLEPEHIVSQCTPQDKANLIRNSTRPVLFVGDGVNDGPGLAAADCGVSVTGAHAAAAATASVVIVEGGIEVVLDAIVLARKTTAVLNQNLVISLAYNLAVIPMAATGLLTPALSAIAMLLSSLSVMFNALRIGKAPNLKKYNGSICDSAAKFVSSG